MLVWDGKLRGTSTFLVPLLRYIFHIIMLLQTVVIDFIPRIYSSEWFQFNFTIRAQYLWLFRKVCPLQISRYGNRFCAYVYSIICYISGVFCRLSLQYMPFFRVRFWFFPFFFFFFILILFLWKESLERYLNATFIIRHTIVGCGMKFSAIHDVVFAETRDH